MAHLHIRRGLTPLALIVCGTLLLAAAAPAMAAPHATDQARAVARAQQRAVHHSAHHTMYHINASTLAQEETPSVTVNDQPIVDNTITVEEVVAPQNGWAVVHTLDAEGTPIANQVVGSAQVSAGTNTNVAIELTGSFTPGDQLQVMLHIDEGTMGTLEFPSGPDTPVAVDGQIVASNFTVQDEGAQAGGSDVGEDQTPITPSPEPAAAQMPNTGTRNTTVPALLIVAGLIMMAAGVLRHVSVRSNVQ